VEGFFDCLKVCQAGAHSVVALMGAALYQQRDLLDRFQHVIVMLDGDTVRRCASATIAAQLARALRSQ
jgi:DNA primase